MHEEVVFVCDSQKWDDLHATQLTFTYSKSTIEALEKGVKYVQSFFYCFYCWLCTGKC